MVSFWQPFYNKFQHLKILDCSSNALGPEGALARCQQSLITLLGGGGATIRANRNGACQQRQQQQQSQQSLQLTEYKLEGCRLSGAGLDAIVDLIMDHNSNTLQALLVRNNRLTLSSLDGLTRLVRDMPMIQKLDVGDNPILLLNMEEDDAIMCYRSNSTHPACPKNHDKTRLFAHAVFQNTTLTHLSLSGCLGARQFEEKAVNISFITERNQWLARASSLPLLASQQSSLLQHKQQFDTAVNASPNTYASPHHPTVPVVSFSSCPAGLWPFVFAQINSKSSGTLTGVNAIYKIVRNAVSEDGSIPAVISHTNEYYYCT